MTALDARLHWQVRNRSTDVTQLGSSQKEVAPNSFRDNDLNMTVPLGGIPFTVVTQDVVLLSMADYPKTLMELEYQFSTEEACWEYLFRL